MEKKELQNSTGVRFVRRMLEIEEEAKNNEKLDRMLDDVCFAGATCWNAVMEAQMFGLDSERENELFTNRAQKLRRKFNEIDTEFVKITGKEPFVLDKDQPFQAAKLWRIFMDCKTLGRFAI